MFQFKINGERLKALMNNKNIKAYKLSKELEKKRIFYFNKYYYKLYERKNTTKKFRICKSYC